MIDVLRNLGVPALCVTSLKAAPEAFAKKLMNDSLTPRLAKGLPVNVPIKYKLTAPVEFDELLFANGNPVIPIRPEAPVVLMLVKVI